MKWNSLNNVEQLNAIREESKIQSVIIFKHSTRCSISAAVLNRIERAWKEAETDNIKPYYLDLIKHRDISKQIEEDFNVQHESPQVLIIKDGKSIYNASHTAITYSTILKKAQADL